MGAPRRHRRGNRPRSPAVANNRPPAVEPSRRKKALGFFTSKRGLAIVAAWTALLGFPTAGVTFATQLTSLAANQSAERAAETNARTAEVSLRVAEANARAAEANARIAEANARAAEANAKVVEANAQTAEAERHAAAHKAGRDRDIARLPLKITQTQLRAARTH